MRVIQNKQPQSSNDAKHARNAVRLLRGILFSSVVLVSFMPIVVFKGLANPFVFGRNTLIRLFACLCVFPLMMLLQRRPETRPRSSALLWSFAALIVFATVNAFFGNDTLRSLAGDLERVDGVFTLLVWGVLFLVVQTLLRSGVRWGQLWDVQIAAGMIACALALFRLFATHALTIGERGSQLIGTLGNPAFFGEYVFLLTIFAGMRAITTVGKHRWLHLVALSIFFTAALWSQVRGVWLGIVVSSLFLLYFFARSVRVLWRRRASRLFSPLIVCASLILLLLGVAVRDGSFSRIRAFVHPFEESTVQQRFLLWRAMGEAFLDRPWFGWGSENIAAAFYVHVPPALWRYTGEIFDRSHNVLFDILVSGGLFGFGLALLFLLALTHTVGEALGRTSGAERRALLFGLSGFAGYAFSLLLLFHTQAASWVCVMFLAFLADRGGSERRAAVPMPGRYARCVIALFAILFVWVGVVQPAGAAIASARALRLFSSHLPHALSWQQRSFAFHSVLGREFAKYFAGRLVTEGSAGPKDTAAWKRAAAFAQQALIEESRRHPWDPSPLLVLAGLEDVWSRFEPKAGIAGLEHLERGVKRHLESTDGRLRLALLLTKAWQGRVAIVQLRAAAQTTPENPYWQRTIGLIHGLLGERQAAEISFQQTEELTAHFFPAELVQTRKELQELRHRIRALPLMHHVPAL